jgi:uncharacterized protein YheU (UPF0270 family)
MKEDEGAGDDDVRVERDEDAPAPLDQEGLPQQVVVPWARLSPAALRSVIEEFVTREGTEYGAHDVALDDKVLAVRRQLERREVVVLFDAKSETVNLATAREVARLGIPLD